MLWKSKLLRVLLLCVASVSFVRVGTAAVSSWYGEHFQGRKMANGQPFDWRKLTAASWKFPLGTCVRVVCKRTGRSVVVTITDRTHRKYSHRIDLSKAAFAQLASPSAGLIEVEISIEPEPPVLRVETTTGLSAIVEGGTVTFTLDPEIEVATARLFYGEARLVWEIPPWEFPTHPESPPVRPIDFRVIDARPDQPDQPIP